MQDAAAARTDAAAARAEAAAVQEAATAAVQRHAALPAQAGAPAHSEPWADTLEVRHQLARGV